MGLLDILLGRTKPVAPDLDQLFGLPSAAITLEAAAGFRPTGSGAVCFATVEGAVFEQTHREVQALLDADAEREGRPVQLTRDGYGYSWLVSRRTPEQLPELVNDLHAVNSAMEVNGFGPQRCCARLRDSSTQGMRGRQRATGRKAASRGGGWRSSTSTSAAPSIPSHPCPVRRNAATTRWNCGCGRPSRTTCGSSRT